MLDRRQVMQILAAIGLVPVLPGAEGETSELRARLELDPVARHCLGELRIYSGDMPSSCEVAVSQPPLATIDLGGWQCDLVAGSSHPEKLPVVVHRTGLATWFRVYNAEGNIYFQSRGVPWSVAEMPLIADFDQIEVSNFRIVLDRE